MTLASRETYTDAQRDLERRAGALGSDGLVRTGDELLAVAGLIGREPRLRRALADPARTGEERSALLSGLLSGKVGDDTGELAGGLVAGRWTRPSELVDGVESLGVEALLLAAEQDGNLDDVEDELFRFGQVADGSPRLSTVLADASLPVDQRASLAHSLLDGKVTPVTLRLVEVALAGFGGRGFIASLGRLVELAAQRRDRQVAYVTTAAPLTEEEESHLGSRLGQMYGRHISLKTTVDPTILGGVRVTVGHDLYDGTILRRLQQTRQRLVGA
jgi:F-type H+-transporting ATPase subunit delta